jgi:hypothetical protein
MAFGITLPDFDPKAVFLSDPNGQPEEGVTLTGAAFANRQAIVGRTQLDRDYLHQTGLAGATYDLSATGSAVLQAPVNEYEAQQAAIKNSKMTKWVLIGGAVLVLFLVLR